MAEVDRPSRPFVGEVTETGGTTRSIIGVLDSSGIIDVVHGKTIIDTRGRRYELRTAQDDATALRLELLDGPEIIATLSCRLVSATDWEIREFQFHDIEIRPGLQITIRGRKLGWKPKTLSYRGKGLGTKLLAQVIERAQKRKVKLLWRVIPQRELAVRPQTLQWYESEGFLVVPPPADAEKCDGVRIQLDLTELVRPAADAPAISADAG